MCVPYIGIVTGIIAIILGSLAIKEINAAPRAYSNGSKGMAIAGLVTGAVGFALFLIVLIIVGFAFAAFGECFDDPESQACKDATGEPATSSWDLPAGTSMALLGVDARPWASPG